MYYFPVDKLFIQQARKAQTFTYSAKHGYQTLTVGQYARGHILINETEFTAKMHESAHCRFTAMYTNGAWSALAKLLRNGDKLSFNWFNNSCEAMKKHDIRVETLQINIWRKDREYLRDLTITTNYSTYEPLNAIKDENR